MKIIGITGPSGAGKTTLSRILKKEYDKVEIIDADEVARKMSNDENSEYYKKRIELFGQEIINENGKPDRRKIAKIIYSNSSKRKQLNKLTFKYVVEEISKEIEKNKNQDLNLIAIDVPLLYEAKMETICDSVIAVVAEDNEKVQRICKRDNIPEDIARKRLEIQNNNEFFVKKADFVIRNDGSIEKLKISLKETLDKIWENG